jgi:hypothetical protein
MKNLKPVPADKQKSLGKLPTDVRNKMGYAKKGSMMKAKKGGGADMGKKDYKLGLKMQGDYKGKDIKGKAKEFVTTALKQTKGSVSGVLKKLAGSQVSDKEAEEIKKLLPKNVAKKAKGGEMKKPMKAVLGAAVLGAIGAKAIGKVMKKKASASPGMNLLSKENGMKLPMKDLYQKATEQQMAKKSMGGEMKQGYGAARTSGMGLQDEDLIPGKSMDYYKDLM